MIQQNKKFFGSFLLTLLLLFPALSVHAIHLTEYLPQGKAEVAVVVCPGGSYCWLSKKTEGSEVARWLVSQGYAAYVLEYPTAGWAAFSFHSRFLIRGHQFPDQINALQEALVKVRSKGYRAVGAMGFSAGGHLVLHSAVYPTSAAYPDFVAPIYPVVSFVHPSMHHRSRRGLLGEYRWHDRQLCDSLSMERHADRIQCPVFLINCNDDPIVDKHNSEMMDSALTAHHKEHFYRQYPVGGHGFGTTASKTSPEAIGWKVEFLNWMKKLKL